MASLALPERSPWTAMSIRDRPGTQRDLRQRLVRRSVGQRAARRMAADVDCLLMAIGRWWRRRATLMPAYDQHDTRRQTTTSMSSADDGLRTMLGFLVP